MRPVLLLLFMCFILASTPSHAQTDLSEYGYKGRVKMITHKKYPAPVRVNDNWDPDAAPFSEVIQTFNPDGNLDTLVSRTTLFHTNLYTKRVYAFSGKQKKSWLEYDEQGQLKAKGFIKWTSPVSYCEMSYDTSGTLTNNAIIYLNNDHNSVKIRSTYYSKKDTLTGFQEELLIRKGYGPAQMNINRDFLNHAVDTTLYKILATDVLGNPTKTLVKTKRGTTLSVREYTYFD